MFTAELFLIAKTQEQLPCLLTDKWINKMWCVPTRDCFSAIKRNEILLYDPVWMNFENTAKWKKPRIL